MNPATENLPASLAPLLTRSLVSLWTEYAGKAPATGLTEIRGNVVTCMLIDAVGDFDRSMTSPRTREAAAGAGERTAEAYGRDAVAAVTRVTRQRVLSFESDHDPYTDVATEVFTLEPSLARGARPS